VKSTRAILSRADRDRLRRFISAHELRLTRERDALTLLNARVNDAQIVDSHDVPSDRVTMHSQVRLHDYQSGRSVITTVTLPLDAQIEADAPLQRAYAMARLLGGRVGDETALPRSEGQRRARIDEVLFQPEGTARRARERAQRSEPRQPRAPAQAEGYFLQTKLASLRASPPA
jgi:regulator of nucleoside diphosphate kinase